MSKLFFLLLIVFFVFSCSNLEINKIECNGDTDKCPQNSICVNNNCEACPEHSIKQGNACVCEFENYLYDKATDKCIKRPRCETSSDCSGNEQCAYALDPVTNSVYPRCIPIGSLLLNDVCDNKNTCQNMLSCLPNPDNLKNKICTKACDVKESVNLSSCSNNETCIDYNILVNQVSKEMVGMCINNSYLCTFEQDNYLAEVSSRCKEQKGACVRRSSDSDYGYCLEDECNPSVANSCLEDYTCVSTGIIYQCIKYDKNSNSGQDKPCEKHEDCKKYLACNTDTNKCKHYCRPNNQYAYDDMCSNSCDDVKNIPGLNMTPFVKAIGYGVVGLCDYIK